MKPITILMILFMMIGCGGNPEIDHDDHKEHAGHDEHDEEGVVHLSKESQGLINLRYTTAEKQTLNKYIEVVGEIAQETENISHIQPPQPGKISDMLVELSHVVEAGTPLFTIETSDGEEVTVQAPGHGVVLSIYANTGETVDNLTSVMSIADPDIMKAGFNVYEKDIGGIRKGQSVTVTSVAYPDKIFEGEIVFISPRVDEKSRTIRIRVNIGNEDHLLKFGMFVNGRIAVPLGENTLQVPEIAVQDIKGRSVVFVPADEEDEFEIREVMAGRRSETSIEIKEGLREGERIVASGSFYLKSEHLKGELSDGHGH